MKLAVIGCGKMGGAMLSRLAKAGLYQPEEIIAADRNETLLKTLGAELGVQTTTDNARAAADADFVLLSVLPQLYPAVLGEIAPVMRKDACVITIAPGYPIAKTASCLGKDARIVRAMPNTPAMIGEGMIAVCRGQNVPGPVFEESKAILSRLGKAEEIDESQLNAVIGISGSAPAYVFMFIDALADAGVLGGLHRDQALRFAAQAVMGSAKLQIETGKHPEVLKDMVCSPAGTTIEAVAALESKGFRDAVITAARAAMEKASRMG
jgi:pyrroline-5-carboxylate reductase